MVNQEENKLNNLELRSEEVQEILSNPPSWMVRWGITIIFIVILLIISASCIVAYPDVVSSKITITTAIPVEKIEAKTSGRIVNLLVENQQIVKKGQVLAVIENTAKYDDILQLKDVLDTMEQDYDEFNFPIHKTEYLSLGELDHEYAVFEKAYTDYVLNKKLRPYAIEMISGQQTLTQLNSRIQVLENQQHLEKKELEVRQMDLNRTKSLFNKGVISKVELENKELEFFQAQRNYQNTKINVSQIQESKNMTRRGIENSNINKTQDDTKYLKEVILSYKQLKRSLKKWEQTYLLIASIDGKVSFQKFWGNNQFVKHGDKVLTILPVKSFLVGKIVTSATNTGKIKPSQKVLIKLDNYPYQEFGMLEGEVITMSLTPDNESNYYIEVKLPENLDTTYNKSISFNQEMTGNAEIITEDLKVIERVFYQFRDVFRYN